MRIKSLDGFRGVACITVLISHFINCFLLGVVDASAVQSTAIGVFINGNTAVRYFFSLCGFTVMLQLINNKSSVRLLIVKKYIRLCIPCFIINFIVYFLMKLNLFYNVDVVNMVPILGGGHLNGANLFEPKFYRVFYESFFSDVFLPKKDKTAMFVAPLWTMAYEMIGTVVVCVSYKLMLTIKKHLPFITDTLECVCYFLGSIFWASLSEVFVNTYLQYFLIGCGIACLYNRISDLKPCKMFNGKISMVFLLIIYAVLAQWQIGGGIVIGIFKTLAEGVLVFALLYNKPIRDVCSSKMLTSLGKYSLGIYICHWPLYMTIDSFILLKFMSMYEALNTECFVVLFCISTLIVIVCGIAITNMINAIMVPINNKIKKHMAFSS